MSIRPNNPTNLFFLAPTTLLNNFDATKYKEKETAHDLLNQEGKERLESRLKNVGVSVAEAKDTAIGTGKKASQVNNVLKVLDDDPDLNVMLAKLKKEGYKINIEQGGDGTYKIDRGTKTLTVYMGKPFEADENPAPADLIGLVAGISHAAYQSDVIDSQAVPLLTDGHFLKGNMTFATNKSKVLLRKLGSDTGKNKLDTFGSTEETTAALTNNQYGFQTIDPKTNTGGNLTDPLSINGRPALDDISEKFGVTRVGAAKSESTVFARTKAIETEFAALEQEMQAVGNATTSRAFEDLVTGASDKEIADKKQTILQKLEKLVKELEGLNLNAATQVGNQSTSFGVETASTVDDALKDLKKRLAEAQKQLPAVGVTPSTVELNADKQKVETFNKSVASLTQRFDGAYNSRHSGEKTGRNKAKHTMTEALNELTNLVNEAEAKNIPDDTIKAAKAVLKKRREMLNAL